MDIARISDVIEKSTMESRSVGARRIVTTISTSFAMFFICVNESNSSSFNIPSTRSSSGSLSRFFMICQCLYSIKRKTDDTNIINSESSNPSGNLLSTTDESSVNMVDNVSGIDIGSVALIVDFLSPTKPFKTMLCSILRSISKKSCFMKAHLYY